MTLILKRYKNEIFNNSTDPYRLGGVKNITSETEYGEGHFAITIFDTRIFATDFFEYVKDDESGKVYVENGEWVAQT